VLAIRMAPGSPVARSQGIRQLIDLGGLAIASFADWKAPAASWITAP
jgi:hypothetical protein